MLKKEITYTDFYTGKDRKETFYFNLTEAETAELNLFEDLKSVGESKDPKTILPVWKRLIRMSVGRNVNGEFIKPEYVGDSFIASDAYSRLFMELFDNDGAAQKIAMFIKAILPPKMAAQINDMPTSDVSSIVLPGAEPVTTNDNVVEGTVYQQYDPNAQPTTTEPPRHSA